MIKYAATLALLSVTIMAAVISLAVVDVNTRLATTFQKLDNEIDEAHRLTLEAGLTVMEARKASVKEIAYLDAWNTGISQTLTDLHQTLSQTSASEAEMSHAAVESTVALNKTLTDVQPMLSSATAELSAMQAATGHLDALIQDPALTATISNVASTTGHLDATAADVQQEVHSLTHPTWLHKIWGGLLDVAHVFNPL